MDSHRGQIEDIYRQRAEGFAAAEKRCARREALVMNLRVAAFLLAAALFVAGWRSGEGTIWFAAGGAAIAVFYGLVLYHEWVQTALQRNRLLKTINQQAVARLKRDWKALPETHVGVPPRRRSVAVDLDLFGHASLFHLLCSANTPTGIRVLRDWFLEPAAPETIVRRQQALRELAPHLDLRQTLILEGRLLADRGRAVDRFVEWAEKRPWLAARQWLVWPVRTLAGLTPLVLLLTATGVLPADLGGTIFIALLIVNILVTAFFGGKIHDVFASLNLRGGEATRYLRMFELMYAMPASSDELNALRGEATRLGGGVLLRLRQLKRIAALAMFYRSPALYLFVYLPLQLILLYDFHVLNLLEAWQTRYGRHVRAWFLALGKFEALASLATLVHDHPGWAMPEVNESETQFRAEQLGHPLLPCEIRVDNDVEIGPAGSFLLVTGSNMSGKSTLLRAIGLNAVLAQAGAPVCARRLAMPPVVPATSMRIRDSLEDGVSFYMAELMRLKEIVDLARDAQQRDHRMLLYLLDEILLGTNSRERHIAVVRVLHYLIGQEAVGAISTHDLDLATSEPLSKVCRCVHFQETLHDRRDERPMTFDYRLRPGIATTSNALKLLEIVGLGGEGI
jgi:hypothetical protein